MFKLYEMKKRNMNSWRNKYRIYRINIWQCYISAILLFKKYISFQYQFQFDWNNMNNLATIFIKITTI